MSILGRRSRAEVCVRAIINKTSFSIFYQSLENMLKRLANRVVEFHTSTSSCSSITSSKQIRPSRSASIQCCTTATLLTTFSGRFLNRAPKFSRHASAQKSRDALYSTRGKVTKNNETWFNLECRFLDYDGVKFGEAGIFLCVAKFRGSKPVEGLEAFPLCYHPRHEQVRNDLIERGRKFRDLAGSHIRHCKGSAFFMNKGKPIQLKIDSRVGVNAAFFHEMQPNYSQPSLRDIGEKEKDGIAVIDLDAIFMGDRERQKEKMRGDGVDAQKLSEIDLLIACPTVCCFSFKEKMFCM